MGGAIQRTSRENYMPGELEFNPLAGELKLGLSPIASVWPRAVSPVPGQRCELMEAVRNRSNPWIPTELWVLPSHGISPGISPGCCAQCHPFPHRDKAEAARADVNLFHSQDPRRAQGGLRAAALMQPRPQFYFSASSFCSSPSSSSSRWRWGPGREWPALAPCPVPPMPGHR